MGGRRVIFAEPVPATIIIEKPQETKVIYVERVVEKIVEKIVEVEKIVPVERLVEIEMPEPKYFRDLTFHEDDDGETGDVKSLGEVIVSLDEQLADHCKWIIKRSDPMFTLIDESKKENISQVNQHRVFRFEPQEPGIGELVFVYKNTWKANSPIVKTVKFTVNSHE